MIQEKFESMMKAGWPTVQRGSPQWQDLQNAFFGGALIIFVHIVEAGEKPGYTGIVDLKKLSDELQEYSKTVGARSDIFRDITGGNE